MALRLPIQSTAGAVPIKNDKGETTMIKVKVQRYVTGERPDYAPQSSSESEDETETFQRPGRRDEAEVEHTSAARERRLYQHHTDSESEPDELLHRRPMRRRVEEPEVLARHSESEAEIESEADMESDDEMTTRPLAAGSDEDEEELSDDEIERRRSLLKQRARAKQAREEELMRVEEDAGAESDAAEESSEYEEYSASEEEEDAGPRMKPVFVRQKERATKVERERAASKQKALAEEKQRHAAERKKQTLRMVIDDLKADFIKDDESSIKEACDVVDSADEDEEIAYESWKIRELKRLKRDRDEREQVEKDKQEMERLRNLTEEERREEMKKNPKVVTNKAAKGKYSFLQKYYHRGAFYLDEEDEVLKRDFTERTLEDHFDKTILPKVMQVKNFGRSGRTKYTHLVDQDTTQFDSPWFADAAMSLKFQTSKAGGMKQNFERPSVRKRKN